MRLVTVILIFIWTQSIALADVSSRDFRFETTTPPESTGTPAPPQPPDTPAPAGQRPPIPVAPPQSLPVTAPPESPPASQGATEIQLTPEQIKNDMNLMLKNLRDTIAWVSEENRKNYGSYYFEDAKDASQNFFSDFESCTMDTVDCNDRWFTIKKLGLYPLLKKHRPIEQSAGEPPTKVGQYYVESPDEVDKARKDHRPFLFRKLDSALPEVIGTEPPGKLKGISNLIGGWFDNNPDGIDNWEKSVRKTISEDYVSQTFFAYFRDYMSWVVKLDKWTQQTYLFLPSWVVKERQIGGEFIYQKPLFVERRFVAHQNILDAPANQRDLLIFEHPNPYAYFSAMPIMRHPLELQTALAYWIQNRNNKSQALQYRQGKQAQGVTDQNKKLMQLWPLASLNLEHQTPRVEFRYPSLPNQPTADQIPLLDMWRHIQDRLEPASVTKAHPWKIFAVKKKASLLNNLGIGDLVNPDTDKNFSLEGLSEINREFSQLSTAYDQKLTQLDLELLKTNRMTQYTDMDTAALMSEMATIVGGNTLSGLTLIPQIDTHAQGVEETHSWFQLQRTHFSDQVSRTRGAYQPGANDMIQGLILPAPIHPLLERFHRVRLPEAFPKGMQDIQPAFQAQYLFGLVEGSTYHSIDSRFPFHEVLYINKHGEAVTGAMLTSLTFALNLLLFYKLHQICRESGKFQRFTHDLTQRALALQRDFRQTTALPKQAENSREDDLTQALVTHLNAVVTSLSQPADVQRIENYCYRVPFLPLRSHFFQYREKPDEWQPPAQSDNTSAKRREKDESKEIGYDGSIGGSTKPSSNPSNTLGQLNTFKRQLDQFLTRYLDGIIIATVLIAVIVLVQKAQKKKKKS